MQKHAPPRLRGNATYRRTLAKITEHHMKDLLILIGLILPMTLYSQEGNKKPYRAFIYNGIEHITNGIDTLIVVDPMPEFPGGKDQMNEFLTKNTRYPRSAVRDDIKGTVFISFVVLESGKLDNIEIKQSVREDLDNEAIRVIKKMPNWKPGIVKGIPVKVRFTVPIIFDM